MIKRYTRKEMAGLWSEENKYGTWLKVELAALQAQAELGIVPREAANEIVNRASFSVERIEEIEETVKHDVIAFTTSVSESIGALSSHFHYGLTSSDVVDTSWCMLTKEALSLLVKETDSLRAVLKEQAMMHKGTVMVGRTHGVHAEPVSFGLKFALWYEEIGRDRARLERAMETIGVGKLSGAVGTYAHLAPEVEEKAMAILGLSPANIATQVIQRDRFAEVMFAVAVTGATLEKIATEIRHLQRTEVREAEEPFTEGQKGSSAMPHKRNPVGAENITGLARLLRGYLVPALENVALWHERDISHSSTERVSVPDATTLLHYMLRRMTGILKDLHVYPENMAENLEKTRGLIYSQKVLLALTKEGLTREDAYAVVQKAAMRTWKGGGHFLDLLMEEDKVREKFSREKLAAAFDPRPYLAYVDTIYGRVFGNG
ncbi:MAG TPA: adenylosuccinate lyase [Acidobacteriota bacterium]|jgi:adenylosuccinate lyase|nr:adenylosuccinate lyase [Acidobacteriota bacterium]HQO20522.1 adenylosuccinate lyase [Acidobacteriota bacterium]HQQ47372.1 adenylosuccinate lyase [Acidobacteriota bacterium]